MPLTALGGNEYGPYQVAVYVVVYSLFSGLAGNQLAEPDGSGRNGRARIYPRHGGGGRFKSADILCGHSSGVTDSTTRVYMLHFSKRGSRAPRTGHFSQLPRWCRPSLLSTTGLAVEQGPGYRQGLLYRFTLGLRRHWREW